MVSHTVSQGSYVPRPVNGRSGRWRNGGFAQGLTLVATLTVSDSITNVAEIVGQDQPDPVPASNSSAAVVNGIANADVGVKVAVDKPAPSVGENVTFTVTVANRGPSPATDVVVTDALPAGLTLVSAVAVAGHVRGAELDRWRARRDRSSRDTDDGVDRSRRPARWSIVGVTQQAEAELASAPTTARASRSTRASRPISGGDQVAHALGAPRRRTADIQRDRGQSGPESGDGRPGHGDVVGRARFRVGGPVAGLLRQRNRHLDGRIDRERRQRGVDDHGARHAGRDGQQHGERQRQRSARP